MASFPSRTRRIAARAATLLTALSLTVAGVGVAHAADAEHIACVGSTSVDYTPGLTTVDQDVAVDAITTLFPCLFGPAGVYAGSEHFAGRAEMSCATLTESRPGSKTITWSDGSTSTYEWAASRADKVGEHTIITRTGLVTAGRFLGRSATDASAFVTDSLLDCTTSTGLVHLQGPATLLIV